MSGSLPSMRYYSYAGESRGTGDPEDIHIIDEDDDGDWASGEYEDKGTHLAIVWSGGEYSRTNTWIAAASEDAKSLEDNR